MAELLPVVGAGGRHQLGAVVAHVVQTEGPTALYKGMVPKLLRIGPGGGILLLAYEAVVNLVV